MEFSSCSEVFQLRHAVSCLSSRAACTPRGTLWWGVCTQTEAVAAVPCDPAVPTTSAWVQSGMASAILTL